MGTTEPPVGFTFYKTFRLEHNILVSGINDEKGKSAFKSISYRNIWAYNLYTGQWRKHVISSKEIAPQGIFYACAVAINQDAYMFGGKIKTNRYSRVNELWKLTKSSEGCFEWNKVNIKVKMKTPSPRDRHSGWEYDGKLWSFGGFCDLPYGYLHEHGDFDGGVNNQLVCFDPCNSEWTNPKCFGSIPLPCGVHTCSIMEENVWLMRAFNWNNPRDTLYQLHMHSHVWTLIQTSQQPKTHGRVGTLTSVTCDKLVLHGCNTNCTSRLPDTYILDLTTHTWSQYTLNKDHCRQCHTAVKGLNNDVFIVGGRVTQGCTCKDYNFIFYVMIQPKSLQQLAMQTVCRFQGVLLWRGLPEKLIALLEIPETDEDTKSTSFCNLTSARPRRQSKKIKRLRHWESCLNLTKICRWDFFLLLSFHICFCILLSTY